MTRQKLDEYVYQGREIEFEYKGKQYSITYFNWRKEGKDISFCEYYKEPTDVKTVDELANIPLDGKTLMQVLEELGDNIWVF